MKTHLSKKSTEKTHQTAVAHSVDRTSKNKGVSLEDNRASAIVQQKQIDAIQSEIPLQKKKNNTGLPDKLKSGMENLSGHSLDDVKVHYNSSKPAQLNAHAYAQGKNIHLASGQEKHLPHEAWHVVQQKQGRVQPTIQSKGVAINDDKGLEKEADVMGAKALQRKENKNDKTFRNNSNSQISITAKNIVSHSGDTVQRNFAPSFEGNVKATKITKDVFDVFTDGQNIIIKFNGELDKDSLADNTLRAAGAKAPESSTMDANYLLTKIPDDKNGGNSLLIEKLKAFKGKKVLVAEKIEGEALGPNPTDPSESTKECLKDPQFAYDLGRVAAYDVLIGNQDRILIGLNLGNMMTQTKDGIPQIDNQMSDNKIYLEKVVKMRNIFSSFMKNEESEFAAKTKKRIKEISGIDIDTSSFQRGFVTVINSIVLKQFRISHFLYSQAKDEKNKTMRKNLNQLSDAVQVIPEHYLSAKKLEKEKLLGGIKKEKSQIVQKEKPKTGFFPNLFKK